MARADPTAVRAGIAAIGVVLAIVSSAWVDPAEWPTYAVFLAFAFAYSFVWLDSDAPTSVAYMAMATAFVYIAGFPILVFELVARSVAYPLLFAAARRGFIVMPRPLRPLAQGDAMAVGRARIDLAAMLGLATIGLTVRVVVVQVARAAGIESMIAMVALGEPIAYGVMGALSAWLPLPTAQYVKDAPHDLPAEDERVDVIFSAVLIVPFLVLLIVYGWLEHGLIGAAAWSCTALAPHWLVQLLVQRRHLLDDRRAAIERVNARLEQKQAEIEHFAYTVAHDLKAPLSAISNAVDCLLDGNLPASARDDLVGVLQLAGDTENMIGDLLQMVRIVSEPERVEMVDLGVITARAIEMLRPHIAARAITIEVAGRLPSIPGQKTKLRHVIANLVENAIRFVPPGTGRIDISAAREATSVVLAVRDNGIGIAVEYQKAVFEMFRRVPDTNAGLAGSGMGLAIVKRIVEAHGGDVWVESVPGAGSLFRLRLPSG